MSKLPDYLGSHIIAVLVVDDGKLVARDGQGLRLPNSIVSNIVPSEVTDEEYSEACWRQQASDNEESASRASLESRRVNGFIYAIVVGDRIKIGRTRDLKKRLRSYERVFETYRLIGAFASTDINHDEAGTLKMFGGAVKKREFLPYSASLEYAVKEYFDEHAMEATK